MEGRERGEEEQKGSKRGRKEKNGRGRERKRRGRKRKRERGAREKWREEEGGKRERGGEERGRAQSPPHSSHFALNHRSSSSSPSPSPFFFSKFSTWKSNVLETPCRLLLGQWEQPIVTPRPGSKGLYSYGLAPKIPLIRLDPPLQSERDLEKSRKGERKRELR